MRRCVVAAAAFRTAALIAVAAVAVAGCGSDAPSPGSGTAGVTRSGAADPAYEVLVFSRTAGFRHDSIAAGVRALGEIGAAEGFAVAATEDPGVFTADGLAGFAAVVFLNTSGDVLGSAGQAAVEAYVRGGGGFVGVHAAADTEYGWPFYGALVGARFARHPAVQRATVLVADRSHPATAHLPARWERTDEWYDFRAAPPATARVLLRLDEASYDGGGMGGDHPHAWCQQIADGRSFYTGGGHTTEAYAEPDFLAHLRGAVRWAAGRAAADCAG